MSRIVPQNSYVLCKKIDSARIDSGNILLPESSNTVQIYQIVDIGRSKEALASKIGDKIVVASTGTKINSNGNEYYLFDSEKIIAKIVD